MAPAIQWWNAAKAAQVESAISGDVDAGDTLIVGNQWLFNDNGSLLGATVLTSPRVGIEAWDGVSWVRSGMPILEDALFEAAITGVDKTGDAGMASQTTSYAPVGSGREIAVSTISVGCGRQISLRLVAPLGASEHGRQVRFYVIPAGSATAVFSAAMTVALTLAVTGNVGIGGAPSVTSGELLLAQSAADENAGIIAKNTSTTGASAAGFLRAISNTALFTLVAHCSARVVTRWGHAIGGWAEVIVSGSTQGLAIGTLGAVPLELGTGSVAGLRFDGTNPHPSFPISDKRTTATFSKTSDVALANVTGLTVNLTAGKTYRFVAELPTTSNVAGGVKFAIAGTATATAIWYEALVWDGLALSAHTRAAALATAVGGVTAVTASICRIVGLITVNAAGTLTVQFAQNASSGTASTVVIGSTFCVVEVA